MKTLIVAVENLADLDDRELPIIREAGTAPAILSDWDVPDECRDFGVRAYAYDSLIAARAGLLAFIHAETTGKFWVLETRTESGVCVHTVITYGTVLALPIELVDMRVDRSRPLVTDPRTVRVVASDWGAVDAVILDA